MTVSFFNFVKRERVGRRIYRPSEEARQDVFDNIEMFYKPMRKHVRSGMLSTVELDVSKKCNTRTSTKLEVIQPDEDCNGRNDGAIGGVETTPIHFFYNKNLKYSLAKSRKKRQ